MFVWHDKDLRVLLMIGAVALFGMIVYLIKHKKIEVKYSIIWLAFSATMILFAVFPYLVLVLGDISGVANPVNFIFMTLFAFILLILLSVSAVISGFSTKIKRLAQANALLEKRVRELEQKLETKGE